VVAVACGLVTGLPTTAFADDEVAAGETVVGEIVQAWADPRDAEEAAAHADGALLTWIETHNGEAVRVPTEDLVDELDQVPVGARVEVTLGDPVEDRAAEEGLEPALEVLAADVVAAPEEPGTAPAVGRSTTRSQW
jgi:hypothetical protein